MPDHPSGPSRKVGRDPWAVRVALVAALSVGALLAGMALVLSNDDRGPDRSASGAAPEAPPLLAVAYQGEERLGATELDVSELLGAGTPVVLNFWADQCPPCRAEMPAFQRVAEAFADEFLLVGVDVGPLIGLGSRGGAVDLLAELGITYPAVYALDANVMLDYGVLGMPTTIFYDAGGVEVSRTSGLLTEDALVAGVEAIVGPA